MFYQGSLQEGISTAVGQQKLVLCFVTNENDESKTWENEYLQDSSLSKLIETQAVALRLLADSDEAGYLSQIFPLPKTPTVVIMKHGELKEYIAAGTSKEDFIRRVLVAFNAAPPAPAPASSLPSPAASPTSSPTRLSAPVPAPAPASHSTSNSPSPSPSPSSQAQIPPTTAQAAAQSEIVSRILAERAAKLQAQKEEAERRAKEERIKAQEKAKAEAQAGADTSSARVHKQAEELKKKRQAEQEERRRILKRIEDDREERRMRAEAKEKQKIDNQKIGDVAASLVNSKQSKLPSTTKVSEMASIQVRLFDGSTIRSRFKTASPLKEVRRWVDQNKGENKAPYTFKQVLTPAPNKNIDSTEEHKSLGELGLVPSSTMVLIPVQNYSTAYPGEKLQDSVFSRFLRTILGFFVWILSLRERGSDATARAASEERRRRVRGLQNLADRQRDHQLYNGNSLNFEPRPDEDDS
ncbi:hypothetical protein M441DRAFT_130831 [Trichoderma asperellum CBS 433.97]|uniref:UBX domain-containing protein 2 n=1 Tax=Trichoderma asperellum (strain ATCC 204424 / CBS 433.97 / NBRC 101777) TaxID=1042311 RepID=A0A2T3ZK54_TRIA4|nr:hypothetical protein M441DRAFT_130831 [Trichoderma asperellum CBS 433.97]PTB45190.1 hypothetical protein M441DRAFT_130831 [Trichoderma asperellum CBS 433.97]